uniref:Carboxylesterase type B domain-containing protein n=1 Tax=Bracon brevicornis TaxID=1563983 RepID=A0A6V7JM35_9HYME
MYNIVSMCLFIILVLIPPIVTRAELSSRIIRTKYGEISGVIVTLERNLESVEVFRGVPYASPPVGSLRFMPPVNGALWQGVKVADKFSPVCPQKLPELTHDMPKGREEYLKRLLPFLRNQSEDCLYLNIYAPAQGMFYIVVTRLFYETKEGIMPGLYQ